MDDAAGGWHTVMPTSHHGSNRLSRPQVEQYELQSLKEWKGSSGNWSGLGKHVTAADHPEAKTKVHARFKTIEHLGATRISVVEKVHYTLHNNKYPVCLARKRIRPRRDMTLKMLRAEAEVMERLDHDHIIKLVGTYSIKYNELYLLIWPVAVCDLSTFLNEVDDLQHGECNWEDVVSRFEALDLRRPDGKGDIGHGLCHKQYLHQIIGCISQATSFCHKQHIRHLDLKPHNILLAPGRVYLADFGIAKDVNQRDHTHTLGALGTPNWRAPEMSSTEDEWSMKAADVYTLGLVLLNILAILYGANMFEFEQALCDEHSVPSVGKLGRFQDSLAALALASQEVKDPHEATVAPKHIVWLTSRMVSSKPKSRPDAALVDKELVCLGGIDQIYHSPCCKKSSRYVTELLDDRQRVMATAMKSLQQENDRLSSKVREYEMRIQGDMVRGEKSNKLLEDERRKRKQLEDHFAEMQRDRAHRRPQTARHERQFQDNAPRPNLRYAKEIVDSRPPFSVQEPATAPRSKMARPGSENELRPATTDAQPKTHSAHPLTFARVAAAAATNRGVPIPSKSPQPGAKTKRKASRLPLPGSPATPIRSRAQTPTLNRDSSLTDSTQHSMASSVLSRISVGTKDTSVSPSPAMGGSPRMSRDDKKSTDGHWIVPGAGLGISGVPFENFAEGASDLGLDGGDSVGRGESNDPSSLVPSASTLSPIDPQSPTRGPPRPNAKSWADVARKQRRGVVSS
ncbi:hypothetical protein N8I77_012548 [Diaporthe amygdali]|uniref:non-specific serine/threonine protein kinase n=1 Tax=Phomopsis amygdali TaxID=1214568 RepID=A0AAD9S497_PHOAM|nr:hypothetical protein N8I77_012548 [Diaporthe amygdali]